MPDRRLSRARIAAAICVGVAAWCSLGVLTLTGADVSAARVGVLPPWWVLAACLAVAFAVILAVRLPDEAARPWFATAAIVVPWLPIPLPPAALVWAGPIAVLLWACAAAGCLVAWWPTLAPRLALAGRSAPRQAPWIAAAVAFFVYASASVRVAPVIPGGDEPHYLIITQSLLKDRDLKIENNHKRGDYLAYVGGTLRPDYLRRGLDREIYSIHLPGVSVLVAPAFAIGGYRLTVFWLAAVAALASMVAWRAAFALTGDAAASWFGWAATALTAPFLFLAFTVYPDGPGGACVVAALAALVSVSRRPDRGPGWWALAGVAPAALPWLHPRFSVLAASIGLVLVARALGERRRAAAIAAFVAVPVVSAAGWFGYYLAIYGSPNPSVAYGHYTQMAAANLSRGVPGLLFDQQFGLVPVAPVYAVAAAGLAAWIARSRRLAFEWALIVVPYVLVTSAYHMWWGGHSSAARFLGPLMLACALPAAVAWQVTRNAATRSVQAALLAVSLVVAAALVWVEQGRLVFNVRDGFALWATWATRAADLARGLPSWFRVDSTTAFAVAAIWVAVGVIAWALLRAAAARWPLRRGTTAAWAAALVAAGVPASMAAAWSVEGATGISSGTGQLALLRAAAGQPAGVGVAYEPLVFGSVTRATERLSIDGTSSPGRPAWAWFFVPRVPAGRYRIWFDNLAAGNAFEVGLVIGRGDVAIDTWRFADLPVGRVAHDLVLPRGVRSVALRGDASARDRVGAITLEPVEVGQTEARHAALVTAARRYGDTVVMGVGEGVYLEPPGLWTQGRASTEILLAGGDGRAAFPVRVRAGAVQTRVELESGAWRLDAPLAAGASRDVAVPRGEGPATALRITTDSGFRPAQVDPASTDTRFLGVWLEFPR